MKKIFTKIYYCAVVILLFLGVSLPASGKTYIGDNKAPTLAYLFYQANNRLSSHVVGVGGTVSLSFDTNEPLQNISVTIAGHAVTTTPGGNGGYNASYTMTSGDTEGRVPFSVTVTDLAGNSGSYTDVSTGNDVEFDMTAPAISIGAPSLSITNGGPVTYTVTYANFNSSTLGTGDITLNTTGNATGSLAVTGSGLTRTVTISGITGDGTLGISIAAGTASDLAGNTAPASSASTTFTVDNTAPTLAYLFYQANSRLSSTVVGVGGTVSLSFDTNEPLQNISVTIAGHAVTTTPGGNGGYNASYTMTSGDTEGRVPFSVTVTDLAGNSGSYTDVSTGNDVEFDMTAPAISIGAPSLSITNGGPVTYTVTYANFNSSTLSTGDITLNTTGNATGSLAVTGSGLTRTVTISGITGDGTLGISIAAGTASDLVGNTAPASSASTTFTVDNVVPTVTIARIYGNPTHDNVLYFQAVFSEAVTGVDYSEFTLTTTGGITSGPIGVGYISATTYNFKVIDVNGTGTARLDFNAGGTGVVDVAGNAAAAFTGGEVYTVDQTAPTVTSINIAGTSPTSASSVDYTVTFSEAVTGVDASDFTVTKTGSADAGSAEASVTGVTGSGTTYTVTVGSVTGNGTLRLDLNASGTRIYDVAANAVSGGFTTGQTYTTDSSIPTLISRSYFSNNPFSPQYAKVGDNITLTIGYDNPWQRLMMTIGGGHPRSATPSNGYRDWTGVYTMTSADTEGNVPWTFIATSLFGNDVYYASTDFGAFLIFDKTPPAVNFSAPIISGTGAGTTVTYNINYIDANFNFSTLSSGDVTLNTTGTAAGTLNLTGSGTSYQATITNISGHGTFSLSIPANTAQDIPGNLATGGTSTDYTISNEARLSALRLNPNTTLTKVSGPDWADYTANLPNGTTSVTVKPTGIDVTEAITVNGLPTASGTESAPITLNADTTAIAVTILAGDGVTKKTYSIVVTRLAPDNAYLNRLTVGPNTSLTTVSGPDFRDYTANVINPQSMVNVTPIVTDINATVTVNGAAATSGTATPVTLNTDTTAIAVTVTAANGTTKKTYRVVITKLASDNALLSSLRFDPAAMLNKIQVPGGNFEDFTANEYAPVTSVKVIPTAIDAGATITVNGIATASGTESSPITLNSDTTAIAVTVTAANGTTKKTYRGVITRLPSNNAQLTSLALNPSSTLTKVNGPDYVDYTTTVPNSTGSVTVTAKTAEPGATLTVNGISATSGTASSPVTLNADTTSIAVTVTAAEGTTKKNYVILVTRAIGPIAAVMQYQQLESPITNSAIVVHQNVSPNGDGNSDALVIEGIAAHPDNKLQIMNRSGALIYEAKGYDNTTKSFDGHSSTNGKLQQPGTYFYSLEYKDGNETKHKTGFIVLKYRVGF